MRLLLDTHCWLWMQATPGRFSADARAIVEDTGNELLLSAASAWEIAIKYALGKLELPEPPERYVPERMVRHDVRPLPVEHVHALAVAGLPLHHRDPFDRLLVAQARVEGIALLTADRALELYEVQLLNASPTALPTSSDSAS